MNINNREVVIETIGLSKTYGKLGKPNSINALLPLSMKIFSGEIVAILGLNGAGKTTFIKLLMGLIYPNQGSGKVFGREFGNRFVRNIIGYLPENHKFPAFLSAYKTLKMFANFHNISKYNIENRIMEVLEITSLLKAKDLIVNKFSKGMKQRLAIATCILHNPDLLILDEPTDGLDPIGRKEIRELLLELGRLNKTILINSHILSEVEQVCDRALILNKGNLIKEGSLKEITNNFSGYNLSFSGNIEHLRPKYNLESIDEQTVFLKDKRETTLNSLIKDIQLSNGLVTEIKKVKSNLEDIFIETVR